MPRRAGTIPKRVRAIFEEIVNDPQYMDVKSWSVENLHAIACKEVIRRELGTEDDLPSVEWAYKFFRPFRRHKSRLDEPWSIASLAMPEIDVDPSDLPHIIPLWWRCLIGGRRLTNREMVWASRLHALRPQHPIKEVWLRRFMYRVAMYARAHRVSEVTGQPFDTSHLDAWMASTPGTEAESSGDIERYETGRILYLLGEINLPGWGEIPPELEDFVPSPESLMLQSGEVNAIVSALESDRDYQFLPQYKKELLIARLREQQVRGRDWQSHVSDLIRHASLGQMIHESDIGPMNPDE